MRGNWGYSGRDPLRAVVKPVCRKRVRLGDSSRGGSDACRRHDKGVDVPGAGAIAKRENHGSATNNTNLSP
jgi:hypothetical protein